MAIRRPARQATISIFGNAATPTSSSATRSPNGNFEGVARPTPASCRRARAATTGSYGAGGGDIIVGDAGADVAAPARGGNDLHRRRRWRSIVLMRRFRQ